MYIYYLAYYMDLGFTSLRVSFFDFDIFMSWVDVFIFNDDTQFLLNNWQIFQTLFHWIISSQSRSKNIFKNSDNMRHFFYFVAECATFENRIGLFNVQHKFTTFPLVNLDHTKSKTSNSFFAKNQFYFSHRMRSLFRQLLANVFPKSI